MGAIDRKTDDTSSDPGRFITREPKTPAGSEPRGRSGAGVPDDSRRRTRDGPTSGELSGPGYPEAE